MMVQCGGLGLYTIFSVLAGLQIGRLISTITGTPPAYRNLVQCTIALANVGNLPLILMSSLSSLSGPSLSGSDRSILYVAVCMAAHSILNFCIGNHLMKPISNEDLSRSKTSLIDSLKAIRFGDFFSPPNRAVFLAVVVALFPGLQGLFFSTGSSLPALGLITAVLVTLGDGLIPCIMICLGAQLKNGPPPSSRLPLTSLLGAVVGRLLVVPLLGIPFTLLMRHLKVLAFHDQTMGLLLLLNLGMPSAISLSQLATLNSYNEAECSSILFWSYLLSLFTMPLLIGTCITIVIS